MIVGLKNWDDINTYYIQNNNPQEELLRKTNESDYLEFCGATAIVSVLHARGDDVTITCPGPFKPQPESVLGNFFHDPRNYKLLKDIRPSIDTKKYMNNRVPQFFPIAIRRVFDVAAFFEWENLNGIEGLMEQNIGIICCMKNPGHYIGVVAYNTVTQEVCYNDPWKGNYYPKQLKEKSGFNRWFPYKQLRDNLTNYRILIGV